MADAREVEMGTHDFVEELASFAEFSPSPHGLGKDFGGALLHLLNTGPGTQDARTTNQLIAKCVIAVRMCIHKTANPASRWHRIAKRVKHVLRKIEREQRVDEQTFTL
jgi:hypothetical protein